MKCLQHICLTILIIFNKNQIAKICCRERADRFVIAAVCVRKKQVDMFFSLQQIKPVACKNEKM